MQVIKNENVNEEVAIKKLDNGLTVMIVPKKDVKKKYVIWGTNYGSNDSEFVVPGEKEKTEVPLGIAHFLEHKLFEQENGTNSLDTLTALGVNANAYTTNNHTAYLFECSNNFEKALDELMDYVQTPYFTDENVEKEKGIIGQEIMMYDDQPNWRLYMNALKAMYHNHPVKLDIAGTIETIEPIDKEVLYKCYNTFYNPNNMVMVLSGDFDVEETFKEVEKRLKPASKIEEIKRIMPEEPNTIVQKEIIEELDVSQPQYIIGIKDERDDNKKDIVKKHIAIEISLVLLFGPSSSLYKKLYEEGTISSGASIGYEFAKDYAYAMISGQSVNPHKVFEELKKEINKFKEEGFVKKDFERIRKTVYGGNVKEFDDVADISRMFLSDYFKGINSFEYLSKMQDVSMEYTTKIFNEVFNEDKMVLSIVKGKENK